MKVRVSERRMLTESTVALRLVSEAGALPGFTAGAHLDLHLRPGLSRQYSLCNPGKNPAYYELAVYIDPDSKGGSKAVGELSVGDELEVEAPQNHFKLVEASAYRLLAAGIGITPIWAMAQQLHAESREFSMHYRTKRPSLTAFGDELAAAPFASVVEHSYSCEGPLDIATLVTSRKTGEHLYVCGPQRFIDPVLEAAEAAGWPQDSLHREYFSATLKASEDPLHSFRVRVASTGEEYEIPPERSIAEVLDEAGHFVPLSCEEGVCGTCMVPLLEGEAEHRDLYMTPQEHAAGDMITLCCSRAKTSLLVVDI